jgi:PAS domain-containing protein
MHNYIPEIEKNKALIDKEWAQYMAALERDAGDQEEDRLLTGMFVQARQNFFEEGIKPAMEAMRVNDPAEVQRIQKEQILPLAFPLYESLNILINMETHEATLAHQEAEALAGKIRVLSILAILSSLIVGGALGFSIVRSINRSVNELHKIVAGITDEGNTGEHAHVYGKDEIGKITGEFNTLLDRINNLSELKRVFDKLEEGVVFIDRQRRVTAINKAACKLIGLDEAAALNRLCPDLFRGMDCAKECKKYDHCRRMADAQLEGKFQEISIQRADDAIIGLHLSAIDLPSKGSLVFRGTDW